MVSMELMRYMIDKTGKHKMSMDIIMGLNIAFHYNVSGGLKLDEFKKLVGDNYMEVLNVLTKQNILCVVGDIIKIIDLKSITQRANAYFNENYGDIIVDF